MFRIGFSQYDAQVENGGRAGSKVQTHIEDDVENGLEGDDVAVAAPLWKLPLLLNMLLLVVGEFIVLLGHPAGGEGSVWHNEL